jgi:hypothetical protein
VKRIRALLIVIGRREKELRENFKIRLGAIVW